MAGHSYQLIESEVQLAPLLDLLTTSSPLTLAIDTEFVRTRTFYAKLGLLQIFDGEQCFLVDPIKVDLSALWPLLVQHHWVLHAFGEDLEILLRTAGGFGLSVFDTQLGAAFMGQGACLGYQRFIEAELGVLLDKGEARTDWLARPLSPAQLEYAALDVIYLLPAYLQLKDKLAESDRWSAAVEECQRMAEVKKRKAHPELVYQDIKNAWRLNRSQLAVLQVLAQWRYLEAERRDLAINNVVKADNLWELARTQPTNKAALQTLDLSPMELRIHGDKLLKLIKQGQQIEASQRPEKIVRMIDYSGYKQAMAKLKQCLTKTAQQHDIPEEVLSSKKLMHQYLSWLWGEQDPQDLPLLLTGWRGELLRNPLTALASGA